MQKRKDEAQVAGLSSWWMSAFSEMGSIGVGRDPWQRQEWMVTFILDGLSSGAHGMSKWRCPVEHRHRCSQGRVSSTQLEQELKPWQPHSSSPAPASDVRGPG